MGVRLRTTLTATAAVAVALCLASIALFAALDSSLAASTRQLALQNAKEKAAARGYVLKEFPQGGGTEDPAGKPKDIPVPLTGPFPPAPGTADSSGPAAGKDAGSVLKGGPPPRSAHVSCAGAGAEAGAEAGAGAADAAKASPAAGCKVVFASSAVRTRVAGGKILSLQTYKESDGAPVTVQGSASLAPARQAMRTLTRLLLPGVPALLALVALFTWLAVGRVLRPVSAIRAKVADITAHGLHERVPEPRTRDEIAALARTVNATLDRLRTAVDAHRQFVADAAHELRSPLAVLRTRLELARPRDKELAAQALDDVHRLQSLTSDLLLLARLDARGPLRTAELDLAQLVAEEAARRRPRLEVRVTLDLTPDILVEGCADHLRRLVANLVDNAVRHAATTVAVRLGRACGHAVLDVEDDGAGIPPEYHTTVFDRFTRLDAARPRDTGGSGLGLAIARDIAAAHGATLAVVTAAGTLPGAHLRAVFPVPAGPHALPPPSPGTSARAPQPVP